MSSAGDVQQPAHVDQNLQLQQVLQQEDDGHEHGEQQVVDVDTVHEQRAWDDAPEP